MTGTTAIKLLSRLSLFTRATYLLMILAAFFGADAAWAQTNFGSVNVGATSDPSDIPLQIPPGTSSGATLSTEVLTLGVPGLDFSSAGGPCSLFLHRCSVTVTFAPRAAGLRMGAVVLLVNGVPRATEYISGTGVGPQLAYDPATPTAFVPAGMTIPDTVAVDGAGNIYAGDINARKIFRIESGAATTYAEGLSGIETMALDGAGNLFVCVGNSVVEIPRAGAQSAGSQRLIGSNWKDPSGIAVDGAGNLFVANTQANSIVEVTPSGAQSTVLQGMVAGARLNSPGGLAIDSTGNLYISDTGNNRVLKVAPGSTGVAGAGVASLLMTVQYANQLALSDSGNLYVADTAYNRILKRTPNGIESTVLQGSVLGHPLVVSGLAVDAGENLYIADGFWQRVMEINRATPPTLTFKPTDVGATSSDSPQAATIENVGNANLIFPRTSFEADPTISDGFTFSVANCSLLLTSARTEVLEPGSDCSYLVSFAPVEAVIANGNLQFTDNELNAPLAQQKIPLTGTGNPVASITSFVANPATITVGESTNLTGVFAGGTGRITPGNIAVTSGTSVSVSPTLTTTYQLAITPISGPAPTPKTVTVTVNPAPAPTISSFVASPAIIAAGESASLTAVFANGTGKITPGPIAVTSGSPVNVSPTAMTIYTLTVTNAVGATTSKQATVTIGTSVSVTQPSTPVTVTDQIMGMNMVESYDPTTAAIIPAFKTAGIKAVRWPGGAGSDIYHWATDTMCQDGYVAPNTSFPTFVNEFVVPSGVDLALTANYGTDAACTGPGDPAEAAAWVTEAKSLGITVSHMTVGNEEYGSWETDLHSKPNDAATYAAATATGYYPEIKAADPNVLVGVSVNPGNEPEWDPTVLADAKYDFVEFHFYPQNPGSEKDTALVQQDAQELTSYLNTIKSELAAAGHPNTPIYVGEAGSVSYNPGKQANSITQALFAARCWAK
jgi:sugar lactone lactonase YvrE